MNTDDLIKLFFGSIITFLFTYLIVLIRSSRTKNNKRNRLIFNLLEVHYIIAQSKFEITFPAMKSAIIERMKVPNNELIEFHSYFDLEVLPKIYKGYLDVASVKLEELSNDLNQTIREYSELNPIKAYELNSDRNFIKVLDSLESVLDSFSKRETDEGLRDFISDFKKVINPEIRDKMLSQLRKDVIEISSETSGKLRVECIEKMNMAMVNPDDYSEEYVNYIIEMINKAGNSQN